MTRPDRELIAQVMLFSQGFRTAETLASKIVPFFNLCSEQLSSQPHYDFGLRALKSVLVSAGHLKRERLQATAAQGERAALENVDISEQEILIQSVTETIVPKLVADDAPLLTRYANSPVRVERTVADRFSHPVFSPTSSPGSTMSPSTLTSSKSISWPFAPNATSSPMRSGFRRSSSSTRSRTSSTAS